MEMTFKNLLYLVGALFLIFIGLGLVIGIFSLTMAVLFKIIPLVLIVGGVYLGVRWWQNRYAQ